MARIDINGIGIEYELLGDESAPAVAITPGGRFNKESGGVPQLAQKLVQGGKRVLLYDRPNCGASDISFDGKSESDLSARTLLGLIKARKLGKTALVAGSAGARVSLIAAAYEPEAISHLVIWWISGEPISLAQLAAYYCGDSATNAAKGGMEMVANSPIWAESIAKNPKNRDILLSWDPDTFVEKMQEWALAYAYSTTSPVPGMSAEDFGKLTMPVLVFRSGKSDISHTLKTSEWVHKMIPHSVFKDPPATWRDDEWNYRSKERNEGRGELFDGWVHMAPEVLAFTQ